MPYSDDDLLLFGDEDETPGAEAAEGAPWKVLIVDDEEEIHAVTKLALSDVRFQGRPVQFLSAYSGAEARDVLIHHNDVAMLLLDVVMETEHAGLDVVKFIRQELQNRYVRIILRTGQPGQAPERRVITDYDINDYKEKTELTAKKLFTVVYTGLSSFQHLHALADEIAAREHSEAQLARKAKELERSNAELEQFAYIASHDLQEPLRKIQAFGSRLVAQFGEGLPARGQDYIGRMTRSAERLSKFVSDLLAFSKVSTELRGFERIDLGELLAGVVSDFELSIEESGAKVEIGPLPMIYGDAFQLRQVFEHLVGNALKFHAEDQAPELTVSFDRQSGATPDEDRIILHFKDRGIGIEDKYLEYVFKPFSRLHGREQYEGSGVGLAICSKIVDRHGGSIHAENRAASGVDIIVNLPVKPPPELA